MSERSSEDLPQVQINVPAERGTERFSRNNRLNTVISALSIGALIYAGARIGDEFNVGLIGTYGGLLAAAATKTFILDRLFPRN